jgi:hypothetical protein
MIPKFFTSRHSSCGLLDFQRLILFTDESTTFTFKAGHLFAINALIETPVLQAPIQQIFFISLK